LPRQTKEALDALLGTAAASFDRGAFAAGVNMLVGFENLVGAQVAPFDPVVAVQLRSGAETIKKAFAPGHGPRSALSPFSKPGAGAAQE